MAEVRTLPTRQGWSSRLLMIARFYQLFTLHTGEFDTNIDAEVVWIPKLLKESKHGYDGDEETSGHRDRIG